MPVCDNVIDESLSENQISDLLYELDQNRQEIISWLMLVMLYTGRRTGEIEKLHWTDIDCERQEMTLRDTKSKDTQVIPFSDKVKQFFETMPHFHDKYVFPNKLGTQRNRSNNEAKDYLDHAGVPGNYRPTYCLRHTLALIAASNDIPDRIIKSLMGHKVRQAKRDITSRYAYVSKKSLLEAANILAIIFDRMNKKNDPIKVLQHSK